MEKIFDLICKITQENKYKNENLTHLRRFIEKNLYNLVEDNPPEDIATIIYNFDYEFERFSEFLSFSYFSEKNIIGIGGKFSSGKSTFLNSLLGERVLPTGTTPTTSIPTLIGQGREEKVIILNIFNRVEEIQKDELKILKHYNEFAFSHLLKHIFVQTKKIKFENIAFLDTPGVLAGDTEDYYKLTDEKRAIAELNNASFVVWCISSEQGTITDEEISILNSIDKKIEKLLILTKADKLIPAQVEKVKKHIKEIILANGLNILDIIPYSSKRKNLYPIKHIEQYFSHWNKQKVKPIFGINFKRFFVKITDYYIEEEDKEKLKLNRINRALTLSDNDIISEELFIIKESIKQKLENLNKNRNKIKDLENEFFKKIRNIAKSKNIHIPEPSELDLVNKEVNLEKLVINYLEKNSIKRKDYERFLNHFINLNNSLKIDNINLQENYDEHTKEIYITLLVALGYSSKFSKNKTLFINSLIKSFNIESIEKYQKKAFAIDENFINEAVRSLRYKDIYEYFFIDAIILLSYDKSFTQDICFLLANLMNIFELNEDEVKRITLKLNYLFNVIKYSKANGYREILKNIFIKENYSINSAVNIKKDTIYYNCRFNFSKYGKLLIENIDIIFENCEFNGFRLKIENAEDAIIKNCSIKGEKKENFLIISKCKNFSIKDSEIKGIRQDKNFLHINNTKGIEIDNLKFIDFRFRNEKDYFLKIEDSDYLKIINSLFAKGRVYFYREYRSERIPFSREYESEFYNFMLLENIKKVLIENNNFSVIVANSIFNIKNSDNLEIRRNSFIRCGKKLLNGRVAIFLFNENYASGYSIISFVRCDKIKIIENNFTDSVFEYYIKKESKSKECIVKENLIVFDKLFNIWIKKSIYNFSIKENLEEELKEKYMDFFNDMKIWFTYFRRLSSTNKITINNLSLINLSTRKSLFQNNKIKLIARKDSKSKELILDYEYK